MKLFLIGYRCTGKSTIGKILGDRFNLNFMDTDRMIESLGGTSIAEIVESGGWEKFRQMEKETLFGTREQKNGVIATGGGIILDPANQVFIKNNGFCIWLDADLKTILHRLAGDNQNHESRPVLTTKNLGEETRQLLKQRQSLYERTAHMRVDTSSCSPEQIVTLIDRRLSKNVRQQFWKSI